MKQNKNAGGNNVCSPSAGPLNVNLPRSFRAVPVQY